MNKRAFTLVELMIVVVIIGILASIAIPRYTRLVEKARGAEAKRILGQIRDAEISYYYEYDSPTGSLAALNLNIPGTCSQSTHYFRYSVSGAGTIFTADRCTSGGKPPSSTMGSWRLNLTDDGTMGGTNGFV